MTVSSAVEHRSPTAHDDNGSRIDAPFDAGFNDLIQRGELPSRWRTVKRGRYETTVRSRSTFPCSTSRITDGVVAVTLVSEARSQIVESGEGTGDFASQVRWP